LAWVPKTSIQVSGATKANERRRFKKQLPSWRFAPNHQNYWSWHHPYSLPMHMWNLSPHMHGYPLASYFDPWCGFLCY
jgi:peptidoglycan/LPS O-acetylase OafA/YrhL